MSIFDPAEAALDYRGWHCGACNGELEPDGSCLPCQAAFEDHVESLHVDIAERLDEMVSAYPPELLSQTEEELQDAQRKIDQSQRQTAGRPGETKLHCNTTYGKGQS